MVLAMAQGRTAAKRLADLLLGERVEVWAKKHSDDERSWPWIARRLAQETNGEVKLAGETLRQWVAAAEETDLPEDTPTQSFVGAR